MSDSAGLVLAGRYHLLDQVAVGAMGEVWRAHDDRLNREVAVKVLRPELADDQDFLDRFRGEARHAASVLHPRVAAVHDYGEDPAVLTGGAATAYLVMDLLDGPHLGTVLAQAGPLPVHRVALLLAQVADALAAAHATGLVHRDIKPANLVQSADRPDDVTVTDFGIARAADAVPVTRTGLVMGTAEYLSPEQARGQRATSASDIYSLGVVAYELLTGQPPFTGDAPALVAQQHVKDLVPPLPETVPEAMRTTVARCLLKDPARRPDATTLAVRLRQVATGDDAADGADGADGYGWDDEPLDPAAGHRQAGVAAGEGKDGAVTDSFATDASAGEPAEAAPARPPVTPATRQIPVAAPARPPGETVTPRTTRRGRARRLRLPVRAPVAALLALLALLLLATVLQQTGLLGAAAHDDPVTTAHVTGSGRTTTHEDGR